MEPQRQASARGAASVAEGGEIGLAALGGGDDDGLGDLERRVDAEWAELLGAERFGQLRETLTELNRGL